MQKYSNNDNIELIKLKNLFTELYQTFANSGIFELYIDLLFDSDDKIDFSSILFLLDFNLNSFLNIFLAALKNVFKDCFYYTLKCSGFREINYKDYSDITLNAIVNSIVSFMI